MNKKVSIVVPIYNVENYLDKCINSIVNQTYSDLEIILVDDGSKDGSPVICDDWKEKDSRVIVIHKENGGLSSARNAGLDVATGEYIMFEDSDDWLEIDIVEKCVERIEKDDSDMVIFGYKKVDEEGKELGSFTFGNDTYSREELSEQLHQRILEMSFGYAWNKLYRLSVIKESGVKNDGSIIDREDLYFNLCLFKSLEKISFLNRVGYYYLQRGSSLLHNANLARLKGVNVFSEKMNVVLSDYETKKELFNMILLHYLADCIIKNILHNVELNRNKKMQLIKNTIDKCPYISEVYYDTNNPRYLNIMYKAIEKEKYNSFARYVKLSDVKSKIWEK